MILLPLSRSNDPCAVRRPLGLSLASVLLVAASPAALAASLDDEAADAKAASAEAAQPQDAAQTPADPPPPDTEPDADGETIVVRAERDRKSVV